MSVSSGSPSRRLFGRLRHKSHQDDMDVHRNNKSSTSRRFFAMSRDDSGLNRRSKSKLVTYDQDDSDEDYSAADESSARRRGGSRLALFRRKLTSKRRRPKGTPMSDESSHQGGGEARALARIHSFDIDEAFPPVMLDPPSFDDEPPQVRSILKRAVAAPPSPRRKPQLINDPTHMPYSPGVKFEQPPPPDQSESLSFDNYPPAQQEAPREQRRRGGGGGQRARYSVYHGSVKRKFRVRPYRCFPDGRTMTEEEIYEDSLKPSQDFTFLNSYLASSSKDVKNRRVPREVMALYGSPKEDGRIGAVRVEVLGCVSLARTKPDISVYLVCGDAAFCTDVLSGYRSPMWPSVSRRAAVFPVHHAFATLYVGVFDVRVHKNRENDSFCGRVAIDIAALRADTEYDVTLPLRASSFVYDRRKRGVIRLRFSLHWFSERAAVVSYFRKAKSVAKSAPFFEGHPTIPCADPKTFRNVAVTVYGADLPGKYTKNAFRSTMREFNLYQQNMTLLVQVLALDAMLYERVHISLYLFGAGMYCVWTNSVRMVPPFIVGYVLVLFLENYNHYVESNKFNLGYHPLTLKEVCMGLLGKPDPKGAWFEPHLVQKKTKRKRGGYRAPDEVVDESTEVEIQPLDHREFPFSERDAYPKLSVEDSLAPGKNVKGGNSRLHGRLSVYYTAAPPMLTEDGAGTGDEDDDDDSENMDEGDDETIMGGQDAMFGLDLDGDLDEEEQEQEGVAFAYQNQNGLLQSSDSTRRIKIGPPQDADVRGRKIPPQVQLQKVEKMLHKASCKVSVELVHAPAMENVTASGSSELNGGSTVMANDSEKTLQGQNNALKKRKAVYDEFDKLLGLQTRTANPVMRIMSSFLGPLMRMIRVFIFVFRISFHVSTWKDPFLSFWCFIIICILCLILIVFPWRSFFLLAITASLGPQNIFVRKYLERKAAEKAMKAMEMDDSESSAGGRRDASQPAASSMPNDLSGIESTHSRHDSSRRIWPFISGGKFNRSEKDNRRRMGNSSNHGSLDGVAEFGELDRPAFRPEHHVQMTSSRKMPRAVAIPYSRLKKDRFFDWPPDPTVSRATPMPFREIARPPAPPTETPSKRVEQAETQEVLPTRVPANPPEGSKELPRGLRRRMQAKEQRQAGIPRDLYL